MFVHRFRFKPVLPFSFELTVQKPAGWSWFTPYEILEKGTIWSGFWFETSGQREKRKIPLGVKAHSSGKSVIVDIYSQRELSRGEKLRLKDMVSESLGISEDLRPFYRLLRKDRLLRPLVLRLRGMHEGWGMNIFSSLTLAVLLQMAPIKRSQDMWDCLIKSYGRRIRFDGKSVLLWPTEETIAALQPGTLARKCRLGYRAKFLVRLARQMVKGFPDVEELARMAPEEATRKLMELYGVGEYSAGFASRHPIF
jgi:3-methyladenine DNA glycosylase/8-oxoguanine DNA glycosylase